ncbi:hypothetical protein PSECIP111951_02259 [Pseudoalteromonas holothuriae]|uniref:tRNA 2-thiouridine-synthesizing protein n=1 Tax=Pseudoalteromonas holothuriae TaxID=2963714 RepID=A0A9W4QZN4_9GAMM|nr:MULTISPECIES: hypothetical protein [unclassified Pseudoalteromonas]CAH9060335.1 hypothetical protein PSECIP111951_02259 [Pseudoalteromonas sp. CIP111951]CAH9060509.1 hypothetical protein PSECIP111854_02619 [Pseudoalteromonas sp. CIP111854]
MTLETVHLLAKPAAYYQNLNLEHLITNEDVIVLIGDACYDHQRYSELPGQHFMLTNCAVARGIIPKNKINLISDIKWVELIDNAKKSISW